MGGLSLVSVVDQNYPPPIVDSLVDPATGSVQPVGQSGYTLVLSEEFGGTLSTVDAANGLVKFRTGGPQWRTWYESWPSFVAQNPGGVHTNTGTDDYYALSKVSLDGAGSLVLTSTLQTTVAGLDYTAGMIQSAPSFTFQYGYVEAKIRMSAIPNGTWPAGWALGDSPANIGNEIDYFEAYDRLPTFSYNNVYVTGQANFSNNGIAADLLVNHVYGFSWAAGGTTFYRDGVQTSTTTKSPTSPMFVLFDLATRAAMNPTYSSTTMIVDYIRVWQ